jgi:cell division protein FtsA
MGAIVCDIGGGTTDLAIYIDGDIWHTMVLAIGGNHITSDIAHGLRLSLPQAEEIKKQYGHAVEGEVSEGDRFTVRAFGEEHPIAVSRKELAHIIEARVEEIFQLVLQEIKRSGYDGLLPAGMVLTGGTSALPGLRSLASEILGLPVRISKPENLVGLVDQLHSPAFSTSVGLLYWALLMNETAAPQPGRRAKGGGKLNWDAINEFLKRLLP